MRVLLNRPRDESGIVAALVAILATVLLILAGFTVDFGQAYVNKRHMQTAADAAALAAAAAFAPYAGTCETLVNNPAARTEAQRVANDYRARNGSSDTSEVQVDCVDGSLRVAVASAGSTPAVFSLLVGGTGEITVSRSAVASLSVAPHSATGARPLALCGPQVPAPLTTGVVRVDFPGAGHRAFPGCPDTGSPGNWWTLDCPGERTGSTNTGLAEQVLHGCPDPMSIVAPQDDTTPVTRSLSLLTACPSAPVGSESCLSGDPGQMDAGHVEESWRQLVDKETSFVLPVFCAAPQCTPSTLVGTGTNAVFPLWKLVATRICGYHFSKQARHEFFQGTCAQHAGIPSVMTDDSADNYVLLAFTRVLTSGTTREFDCALGTSCDGGLRRMLLVE